MPGRHTTDHQMRLYMKFRQTDAMTSSRRSTIPSYRPEPRWSDSTAAAHVFIERKTMIRTGARVVGRPPHARREWQTALLAEVDLVLPIVVAEHATSTRSRRPARREVASRKPASARHLLVDHLLGQRQPRAGYERVPGFADIWRVRSARSLVDTSVAVIGIRRPCSPAW